ncbi:DUF5682 family protein [Undibacterium sp. TJN19]|uniref:DUF5682 family protein n=1 Tax=Undibacterium sp. TJN19 TaxID=3413055 RepID=UPI003BF31050
MSAIPHIIGVRHHSPACARLVAARIRSLQPAYVLIEGPADFNARLDELALPHRLPVAIYSYLSGSRNENDEAHEAEVHHGSWTPFSEHSPEWQAISVGRDTGAQVRFIDLPAWHDAFAHTLNRYADDDGDAQENRAEEYIEQLGTALNVEGRDALWDQLFEDEEDLDTLCFSLTAHFKHLRNDDIGSLGNQERETMMARWIAWAVAQRQGPVIVVCGGYHAPALAKLWPGMQAEFSVGEAEPATPTPANSPADSSDSASPDLRYGSFLVPYTFKRLDAFTGYASGMPSPAYYQWLWAHGHEGAARHVLQAVLTRLREKKLAASTADLIAVQVRAQALTRLRGHRHTLRNDWLDALAGALVKDALDAPLPWSYRGPIRAGTDPVLVQIMDVLAGDMAGQLAAGTPQPPLIAALRDELAAADIRVNVQPHRLELDLLTARGRSQSQLLHRVALLELPGFVRNSGPQLALSGERKESWTLSQPFEQQAALIEAGAWGATLLDAARARLEDSLRKAGGRITELAKGLNRAAFAGLHGLSKKVLADLQTAVAHENQFEALGPALGMLFTLLRHGHTLGMADAPVLRVVIEAGVDRALWLLEPPGAIPPGAMNTHIQGFTVLRQIAVDVLSAQRQPSEQIALNIEVPRLLAVLERKAANTTSAALSRGAALGAIISLRAQMETAPSAYSEQAITVLQGMAANQLGDAVSGLLALAREQLLHDTQFVAGLDAKVQTLDDSDFVIALPALRSAFTWLPTRERGNLAEQVLALHQSQHLPRSSLTAQRGNWSPEQVAANRLAEQKALAQLQAWGIPC